MAGETKEPTPVTIIPRFTPVGRYNVYLSSGKEVATDFITYDEAEDWAIENGYTVIFSH